MSDQKKDPTNVDLDDFLDLDFGVKPNTETGADTATPTPTPTPAPTTLESRLAQPIQPETTGASSLSKTLEEKKEKVLSSKEELELEFANSKAKSLSSTLEFETSSDEPTPDVVAPPKKGGLASIFGKKDKTQANAKSKVSEPKASKSKGGLFGKKAKADNNNDAGLGDTTPTPKPAKKLNPAIIGGVIAVLLVVIALFALLGGDEPAPEPVVTTPPPTLTPEPATETPPPPPPETTTDATANVAGDPQAPMPTPTTGTGTDIIPTTLPEINPDEILNAQIPEDPALLKEEIDRLSDTESQLAEQSKMIEAQLNIMNDLTKAKDEEIALLEAQIAELEKQKGK